jgi:hypothetical protein
MGEARSIERQCKSMAGKRGAMLRVVKGRGARIKRQGVGEQGAEGRQAKIWQAHWHIT